MIYHAILFLCFVVLAIAGEGDKKYDVKRRSKKEFKKEWYGCSDARSGRKAWFPTPWHQCVPDKYELEAKLLCKENGEKIVGIKVTIMVHTTATYEIVSFDKNMDEKQLLASVCQSIIYKEDRNYRQATVSFYTGGEWLCDVYKFENELVRSDKCAVIEEEKRQLTASRLAITSVTKVLHKWEGKLYRCTKEGKRLSGISAHFRGWHQCRPRDDARKATFLCKDSDSGERLVGLRANNNGGGITRNFEVSYSDQPMDEKLLEAACEGIKTKINNKYYIFTVSFYNDKTWWCDVSNYDGTFLKLDKCDAIAEETSWLEDNIPYKSATLFALEKYNYQDECPVRQELQNICQKNGVTFKAIQICSKYQGGSRALRIVISYQSIDLKDFVVVPSSKTQNMGDGMEKSCRLFNAVVRVNGSKIKVQYFHTGFGMRCGVWKCMEFNKKDNGFEALDYDKGKTGKRNEIQQCLKFNEYNLPYTY